MRLTLNSDEVQELIQLLSTQHPRLCSKLSLQYQENICRNLSKKQSSIQEATKSRERTAKNKILNAINILRLQGKDITLYAITKESGCSYNTVKKYYSKGVTDGR